MTAIKGAFQLHIIYAYTQLPTRWGRKGNTLINRITAITWSPADGSLQKTKLAQLMIWAVNCNYLCALDISKLVMHTFKWAPYRWVQPTSSCVASKQRWSNLQVQMGVDLHVSDWLPSETMHKARAISIYCGQLLTSLIKRTDLYQIHGTINNS